MSVEQANVVILVFAMDGCPACKDYLPKLRDKLDAYQKAGYPLFEFKEGMIAAKGTIPVLVIDSQSSDPSVVSIADQYQVTALPTTVLLPRYGFPARWEGSLPDTDIDHLFQAAAIANG